MNWTQPICNQCYDKREPNRKPVIVINSDVEICCDCGTETFSGIYYRVDPRTVEYPTT
jgi:hypothetical protein